MQHLFVGVALLVLGLFVGIAFIFELGSSGFGVDQPHYYEQDEVEFLDEPNTVTVELENDKILLFGRPAQVVPDGLVPEGLIPAWEQKNIDQDGVYHYRVRTYDTLYKLARIYLGNSKRWDILMEHNPEIRDPRDVFEGMTIKIPLWLREG